MVGVAAVGGDVGQRERSCSADPARRAGFRNTISVDQVAAEHVGGETRFPSLSLSAEGFGLSWTRSGAQGGSRRETS